MKEIKILEMFKSVLAHFNIESESKVIVWSVLFLVMILLFKYFIKEVEKNYNKEHDELKDELENYSHILLMISKYHKKDTDKLQLYYDMHKLLPVCSIPLKDSILNTNIDNDDKFDALIDKIIQEFNILKDDVSNSDIKLLNKLSQTCLYYLKNSGIGKIIKSAIYTFISIYAILLFVLILYKSSTLNFYENMLASITIVFCILYLGAIKIYIIDYKKVYKNNKFNICCLIILFIVLVILIIRHDIISAIIFDVIFALYLLLFSIPIFKKGSSYLQKNVKIIF
ncbi:hypothetical protein [Vallitalea guaymasensis]|uniref:hypothetical protein n=1 Tax=Vallitalea guaymasensis TaxID=1185412 RepID=UPI000DE4D1BD|nr:hypothetical protein [Vallitalea guaymasensis]